MRHAWGLRLLLPAAVSVGAFLPHTLPPMRSNQSLRKLCMSQGGSAHIPLLHLARGADRSPPGAVGVGSDPKLFMTHRTSDCNYPSDKCTSRITPPAPGDRGKLEGAWRCNSLKEHGKARQHARMLLLFLLPLIVAWVLPTSAGAALLEMGGGSAKKMVIENQAFAASTFFFNILTPAAVIAAGALQDAFIFVKRKRPEVKWQRLTNAYCALMVIAFGLQLMTVFMVCMHM